MKYLFFLIFFINVPKSNAQEATPGPGCYKDTIKVWNNVRGSAGRRGSGVQYIIDDCMIICPLPTIIDWDPPLTSLDYPTSHIMDRALIHQVPLSNTNDLISLFPGVYQSRRGDALSIFGGREDGNLYIVDGVWQ